MSAQNRGWGPGWPVNRLADQKVLKYITGRVHKDIHELVSLLCAETERRGYKIRKDWSWGYASRPIAGTRTPSNHSWGLAVDINAPKNPWKRPLTTDMPDWLPALWKRYGFRWGGDYQKSTPDPMHFEFMGTPTDAKVMTERARKDLGMQDEEWDVLKKGDEGAKVSYFQRRINDALGVEPGESGSIAEDGIFGPRTEAAVARIQDNVGFPEDGVIDMTTAIYIQALAHSNVAHSKKSSASEGLSVKEADGRYVKRGTFVKLP